LNIISNKGARAIWWNPNSNTRAAERDTITISIVSSHTSQKPTY